MSTKKIVIIIISIVLAIGLLIAIFIGAVVGVAFYSIGHSDAAQAAKDFLRTNKTLTADIGEVHDFGSFPTGNINVQNNEGKATINLKVIGANKTVNASVDLIYTNGSPWRVVSASYRNDEGNTVPLLTTDESRIIVVRRAA